MNTQYTTNLVSKAGGQWQVLRWESDDLDGFEGEWTQIGPYYDTEAEADEAIARAEHE
jgi:hypothetical protein